MATRYQPQPLDALLAVLPSMPRPILTRLTARLIERLDELDGDEDLEDDDPAGGSADDVGELDTADDEDDGNQLRAMYRNRIRSRACVTLAYRDRTTGRETPYGWRLKREPSVPSRRVLLKGRRRKPR